VSWRIDAQESEVLQTCLWAAAFIMFLKFAKYNVSIVLACDNSTIRDRNLHDWALVIKEYYIQNLSHDSYSFSNARTPCVFGGPDMIRAFSFVFEKIKPFFVNSDQIAARLLLYFGYLSTKIWSFQITTSFSRQLVNVVST
jgi:hypothetical protein